VNKEAWDVFKEQVAGSKLPSKTGELKEKARARAVNPGAFSGLRQVLAGEPSGEEIDGFELFAFEIADVFIVRHLGPMFF
jgi:hypothetical protein